MSFSLNIYMYIKSRKFIFKSWFSYCPPASSVVGTEEFGWYCFEIKRVACVSQDILYCLRISAVLLNSSTQTGIILLSVVQTGSSELSQSPWFLQSWRPCVAGRRELAFSRYLFAFGLEEEAERFFDLRSKTGSCNGTRESFLSCAQSRSPWVPTFSIPQLRKLHGEGRMDSYIYTRTQARTHTHTHLKYISFPPLQHCSLSIVE